MELQLTESELDLLVQILEEHQAHFLHEIAKADHHEFKENLRRRCQLLENMLDRLTVQIRAR
jgi:hypothetical protein